MAGRKVKEVTLGSEKSMKDGIKKPILSAVCIYFELSILPGSRNIMINEIRFSSHPLELEALED